ncbi:unnamed protein product [Staurois parvus]|uniref:Beta-glucosidase n=1 Tax=Staurois parvus TaxID=386267 RepID=A0ABN9E610_9NEOB|nr:unnamed protein product [Staurois parvus]
MSSGRGHSPCIWDTFCTSVPPSGPAPPPDLCHTPRQGRTDNSWGPRAIGDHGAPVSLPKLKKAYEKGTRGIS